MPRIVDRDAGADVRDPPPRQWRAAHSAGWGDLPGQALTKTGTEKAKS